MGHGKCIILYGTRVDTREPRILGICDLVTVILLISESGHVLTPHILLSGKEARYRKRPNGKLETPAEFPPKPSYLFISPVAGVDINIFYTGSQ